MQSQLHHILRDSDEPTVPLWAGGGEEEVDKVRGELADLGQSKTKSPDLSCDAGINNLWSNIDHKAAKQFGVDFEIDFQIICNSYGLYFLKDLCLLIFI